MNQEEELLRVLDDVSLPLDNTRSERALRKIVVGRKAWMFYGSDTHAEAAAAIFGIIASCRLHRLDPFAYLDDVLRVLPLAAPPVPRVVAQALAGDAGPPETRGAGGSSLRIRDPGQARAAHRRVPRGRVAPPSPQNIPRAAPGVRSVQRLREVSHPPGTCRSKLFRSPLGGADSAPPAKRALTTTLLTG
jgi:hypothetical protein